jgi:peptidoglycan/LPS O-acetylase OafA/YrhL
VLYGNGWVLSGGPGPGLWGAPFARVGIDMLFAVTGFLTWQSWTHSASPSRFWIRRVLRVFPALIACVVVTILVIGPLATTLSLRFYFLNKMTMKYLANVLLYPELWLPGVFRDRRWNGVVNPMVWTMLPGVLCYATIPLLGRIRPIPRRIFLTLSAAILTGTSLGLSPTTLRPVIGQAVPEIPFFLIGVLLSDLDQDFGPRLWRADVAMLVFFANWIIATWFGAWDILLEFASLPYMAVCFGRLGTPPFTWLGRFGNPTYGIYLFGFPIQQLVLARMHGTPYPVATALALTLPLGYLCWHAVEQPALRLSARGTVVIERGLGMLARRVPT